MELWPLRVCRDDLAYEDRAEVHFSEIRRPCQIYPTILLPPLQSNFCLRYINAKLDMAGKAPLIVPALKRHTATVIVAHGLGDSGAGWYASTQMVEAVGTDGV